MKIYLVVLFAYSWTSFCLTQNEDRIIGGFPAQRHQFPYIVNIHNFVLRQHACGGSIVSKKWIVTAGHCFKNNPPQQNEIIAGMLEQGEINPDIQRSRIYQIIPHPDFRYDDYMLIHDILLVQLSQPLFFTQAVKPIPLPNQTQGLFGTAVVSGWGRYTFDSYQSSKILKYLEINILSNQECELAAMNGEVSSSPSVIQNSMICTHVKGRKSTACHGDSGGPLVQNGVLIGVVSFGDPYCGVNLSNHVTVFTRVSSYIDFIMTYVKPDI